MFFSDGRHFKLRYALTVAKQIYGKINEQKEHLEWPLVRRTGKTWFPTAKWVGSWFGRHWLEASQSHQETQGNECTRLCSHAEILRLLALCDPVPAPLGWCSLGASHGLGYYKPDVRFNRDQVRLQFDFNGYSKDMGFSGRAVHQLHCRCHWARSMVKEVLYLGYDLQCWLGRTANASHSLLAR